MTREYEEKLEAGQKYQDYIVYELYNRGFPILQFNSKHFQINKGESINGVEIKHDRMFRQTQNLYIEFAEKKKEATQWVRSGIMREDNAKIMVIGDYQSAFVFFVKHLQEEGRRAGWRRIITDTSKGFLLPLERAEELAGWIIDFEPGEDVHQQL